MHELHTLVSDGILRWSRATQSSVARYSWFSKKLQLAVKMKKADFTVHIWVKKKGWICTLSDSGQYLQKLPVWHYTGIFVANS
jgi:hypothetical protein